MGMKKECFAELHNRNKLLVKLRQSDDNDLNILKYGGASYYSSEKGVDIISSMIQSGEPFLVGRFGETELRTMDCYERLWYNPLVIRRVNWDICVNAGFFPKNIKFVKKYCDLKKSILSQIDVLGICLWESEEYYVTKYMNLRACFLANVLDPLYWNTTWTCCLKGKKVLVIHPFADSILSQYHEKRLFLFPNTEILPEFELKVIKAVQSIGGEGNEEYGNWFDALQYMKDEVDRNDFDIALLGCGAYGLPLGAYIKEKGKQAIYVGGSLQLMFGILGRRWENQDYVKKFVNEYWVRPSKKETPETYQNIEGGCYW